MIRIGLAIICVLGFFLICGCSDSDDPVVAPPAEIYEAHGDISNFLVGDGTTDTRMTVHLGSSIEVADNILPNGTELDTELLLGAESETAALGISLTHGDGTILNEGETFSLVKDRRYLFMAMGYVNVNSGRREPRVLQLTPLAKPGVGQVQFRFINALVGNTDAVDVHVNGKVISNIAFGDVSAPVTFAARPVGQDTLIVVPTGWPIDSPNEIWRSTGHLLFVMDEHYDGVLAHHPKSVFDGDLDGKPAMVLMQSPY